jgi:NAD(P)-dependent dehydrogenase (short-subunit alcohol dehydrogenase family)
LRTIARSLDLGVNMTRSESNAVLPGWVRTAMAERSAKTEAERSGISVEQVWRARAAIYPQNRVLEPREVAQVIAIGGSWPQPDFEGAR